ncbi:hypothetical protein [Streptomyces sp. KLOTTS4A1]|uniref:hypothetical protein n=1 Tax=Streptomyces sp. KLOTTS4A1 TaxID=3390996 RepID=UPI0039F59026
MSGKVRTKKKARRRNRLRKAGQLGSAPRRLGLPKPSRRAEQQARQLRRKGLIAVPVGLVVFLVGAVMLFGLVPDAVAEERAYKSAVPCAFPDPGRWQDCLQTAWFTVQDTKTVDGKNSAYWVDLSGHELGSGRAHLHRDAEAFLDALERGELVPVTVWRGRVVAVHDGDHVWATGEDPRGDPLLFAAGGGVLLLIAGYAFFAGPRWLLRPWSCIPEPPRSLTAGAWLITALIAEVVLAAFVQSLVTDASLWLMAGVWLVSALVTVVVAGMLLHRSRGTATG